MAINIKWSPTLDGCDRKCSTKRSLVIGQMSLPVTPCAPQKPMCAHAGEGAHMENQGAHEGVEGLPPTTPAGITAASMRRMKSRNERSQPRDQHEILDMSDDAARA